MVPDIPAGGGSGHPVAKAADADTDHLIQALLRYLLEDLVCHAERRVGERLSGDLRDVDRSRQSGYDGQPAVFLYIVELEVNVLNCRGQSMDLDDVSAETPCARFHKSSPRERPLAAYRASAPRDVPVPTLDAASTRTSTSDP
jgi:hypothetical protein